MNIQIPVFDPCSLLRPGIRGQAYGIGSINFIIAIFQIFHNRLSENAVDPVYLDRIIVSLDIVGQRREIHQRPALLFQSEERNIPVYGPQRRAIVQLQIIGRFAQRFHGYDPQGIAVGRISVIIIQAGE